MTEVPFPAAVHRASGWHCEIVRPSAWRNAAHEFVLSFGTVYESGTGTVIGRPPLLPPVAEHRFPPLHPTLEYAIVRDGAAGVSTMCSGSIPGIGVKFDPFTGR